MLPLHCTTCVPSCSLFPRSAGGKVMLPPPQGGAMMNQQAVEGWGREAPVDVPTTMHPPWSCRRENCVCPRSSSGRPLLQHAPDCHARVLNRRRSRSGAAIIGSATFGGDSRTHPPTPIPSPHNRQTISSLAVEASPSINIPTSHQVAAKSELTSSVRTFRFKNASIYGQNANRRGTKSPSRRPSSSDTDGSLKEINVTRRARRQIYLKPDVEGSPFRLLMYVDCRSVEPQQELG